MEKEKCLAQRENESNYDMIKLSMGMIDVLRRLDELEAEERKKQYGWHDIKANPSDLPKSGEVVLTWENKNWIPKVEVAPISSTVKYWKHIEPFEE